MMKRIIKILVVFVIGMLIFSKTALAEEKNEVTLNFCDGIIHDGYVKYDTIGSIQLFKGDELVNIENDMKIDLNETEYSFQIKKEVYVGNPNSVVTPAAVRLTINGWRYSIQDNGSFKLDSSKFNGILNVKLERINVVINTKVEKIYDNITSTGVIDLTSNKKYVIDFSKNDELTNGLKMFADLDKTLYYKNVNGSLLVTDNEEEAIIKIVGNKNENNAEIIAVNIGDKKEETFKGSYTKYTGSKLQYDGADEGVINETRSDYYTICAYNFTFKYANKVEVKEHKFLEGENQTYIKDESKDATFRIDADYSLFTNKVYVDDNLLDIESYESKEGSTIITLKDSYLKTLSIGEHTLKVVFSDGITSKTKFIIKEKDKSEIKKDTINTIEETKSNGNSLNPKTGDNITTYITLFIISVLGIVASVITNNKKKREN